MAGIERARDERVFGENRDEEVPVGDGARHGDFGERRRQFRQRGRARRAVHDRLGEHRIVVRRHRVAGLEARVDARIPARQPHEPDRARRRQEPGGGVLRVEPRLDRVPLDRNRVLDRRQGLARRHP